MMWVISLLVILLYIHLFNTVAHLYLDSDRTLTLHALWRKVVPPIRIEL
jgi:hypothetical protein